MAVKVCKQRFWKQMIRLAGCRYSSDSHLRMYEVLKGPGVVLGPQHIPVSIVMPPYALPEDPTEASKYNFANTIKLRLHAPKAIDIKDDITIERMRKACRIGRVTLNKLRPFMLPGVSTEDIDHLAHMMILEHGAYPSPLNYKGFPKSVCTSVNNVVVHGIPDDRPLETGDIINVDISVFIEGVHGDLSETFMIGRVDKIGRKLVEVTKLCLDEGIRVCRPGQRFNMIGKTIQKIADENGFRICPTFVGHGIGKCFHEPPQILHHSNNRAGVMRAGMTFTIEPVLVEGSPEVAFWKDGWTCVTVDGGRAAQFEHTVLITEDGHEVLTADSKSFEPDERDIRIYWNYIRPGLGIPIY